MRLTKGIAVLLTLIFLSSLVLPVVAVPDVRKDKIEKDFVDSEKKLTYKKDGKPLLEVKQISIKEGICKFEEVFEVTALNEDYTPSKDKDFKLRFENKKQEDAKHKITSEEWFVWEDNEWKQLKWNWLGKTDKIKKGGTKRYKVILTKQAELGDKRILTVPSFMGIEDERLSWWNMAWQYRINSTLNDVPSGGYVYNLNVYSGSGTNNQTDVFLNGDCQPDFDDIRFVLDDTTELDYWIEDNSTDPVKVWVEIPSNGTVYLYYDNPDVNTASNKVTALLLIATLYSETKNDCCYSASCNVQLPGFEIPDYSGWRIIADYMLDTWVEGDIEHSAECVYLYLNGVYQGGICEISSSSCRNVWDAFFDTIDVTSYVGQTLVAKANASNDVGATCDGSICPSPNHALAFKARIEGEYYNTSEVKSIWGDWGAVETETTFTEYSTTQHNTQRKLARTSEGYIHRVYTKFDGSNYRVYYAKSTDSGSTWIETVLTDAEMNNTHPAIASDSEDNLWVVYEKEGEGIIYRKYEGLSWQAELNISSVYGFLPVIAVDSNDNIHVAWFVDWFVHRIGYRTYNGTTWESVEYIRATDYLKYPSIAVDANNYVHVVWQEENATTNTLNIKHRKKTTTWQPVYNITLGETYNQTYPCIAADLSGNAHIVWQTQDYQIKSIKYKSDGSWEAIKTVHNGGIYEQRNPSVSVYSDNYVYATWFGQTATYNENYIIRESHKTTGSWSGVSDILHPSGKDVVYPNSISALYPVICGDCYLNIPLTGYSLIYDEDGTVEYYNASTWRCEDKYVLIVRAKDYNTNQVINNFTVDSTTGGVKSTTNGIVKYTCLDSGYYVLTVSSSGYHPAQQSYVIEQSKEVTIYLTPTSEADYFLPEIHEVRFMVVDGYGVAVEDVTVTANCIETTLGSWDLLMEFFGFKNVSTIQNTTMTGTTDSGGEIVFPMVKTIKYQITFVKGSDINKTLTIYPIDNKYVVRVGTFWDSIKDWFSSAKEDQLLGEKVSWNITTEIINDTHAWIKLDYNDTLSKTTNQYFFVNDSNNTNLYNVSTSGEYVWNPGYVVSNYSGQSYIVGFEMTHGDIGDFKKVAVVTFKHVAEKLVDFGWDDSIYQLVSVALLIFTAALFTGVTVKHGAVMLPLEGWVFWYIGWFEISIILLSIATSIGIGVYVIERGRETNVSS